MSAANASNGVHAGLSGESDRRMSASASSRSCPMCGGYSAFGFVASDRNRRISAERFTYNRCVVCSTFFMVDIPDDLERYYGGEYHQFDAAGNPPWRNHEDLLAAERWRVDTLLTMVNPGRLIDVGAGAGGFVAAAGDGGFQVTAVEMDSECCRFISTRLGAEAICSDRPIDALRALPPARVVSLWHVLEHLREPGEMLAVAADRLEPGGVLALAVPNPDSIQFRLLGARWPHVDAPRHLSLIPGPAIVRRTREVGLELISQTTGDPSGLACNLHGWVYGLRRDPSHGPARQLLVRAGGLVMDAVRPLERRNGRGAALTMFLRRMDG